MIDASFGKLRIEENFFNLIEDIYKTPIADTIEILKAFPQYQWGIKWFWELSLLLVGPQLLLCYLPAELKVNHVMKDKVFYFIFPSEVIHKQFTFSCSFHTLPKFHKLYSESKTLFAGNIVLFSMYLIINISFRIMNVPVVYLYADAISFGMQEEFYFGYTW